MKKQIILASIAALLFSGSSYAMSQPVFETQSEFEKYEGQTCKSASDGCNSFFVENGKITGGTEMFCENHTTKWTCLESQNIPTIQTLLLDSHTNNSPEVQYGTITDIENGKDGQQIYITTPEGVKYSTAVSVHDTIIGENIGGLYLGTRIKIYYTDQVEQMRLLIGDKVEIVSVGLSENDENFYKVLQKDVNKAFQTRIETFIKNYTKKMSQYNNQKQIKINNKVVNQINTLTSQLLNKYPQDIALPKKANDMYLKLEYLKFSFMDIDFYKNK